MQQLFAQGLHSAICLLESIHCEWQHAVPLGDPGAAALLGQKRALSEEERIVLNQALGTVETHLRFAGLPTSGQAVTEFRSELLGPKPQGGASGILAPEVVLRIDEIQRTIRREMSSVLFLYVPSYEAMWYSAPLRDWEPIVKRWPPTEIDISESSKCWSLDRFAAAI